MTNELLDVLPKNEWDKFIANIVNTFVTFSSNDTCISREDLEQEAWLALLSSCKTFKTDKDTKFTTYAYTVIRSKLMRFTMVKSRSNENRIPFYVPNNDKLKTELDKSYIDDTHETNDIRTTLISKISDEPDLHLLISHFFNGKTLRALAKENGISHAAVNNRINRLLDLLSIRLSNERN